MHFDIAMTDSYTTGDRPATKAEEIEITPEMIRAGARELALYSDDYESKADAVSRIFTQMAVASLQARARDKKIF